MTADYTIDRAEAADMLADFGQAVTITRNASGAYNPATGAAAITTTTQSANGVFLPLAAFKAMSNSNIVAGDQQMLLAAVNTTGSVLTAPRVDDSVTDAIGDVWTIVAVDPLTPAGTSVLFDCVVRRAA